MSPVNSTKVRGKHRNTVQRYLCQGLYTWKNSRKGGRCTQCSSMNLVIKNRYQKMPSNSSSRFKGPKGSWGPRKHLSCQGHFRAPAMARPPASWRWQEHQELCGGGKKRMDITPGDPWGWAVPLPCLLITCGTRERPSLPCKPSMAQLSAELCSLSASWFRALSSLWYFRAASLKIPV